MSGISDVKFAGGAFVDISRQNLQSKAAASLFPKLSEQPAPTASSFDNRAGFTDFLTTFRSRFADFHNRLSSNTFLSDSFTRLITTARVSDADKILAKADSAAREDNYNVDITRLATSRTARSKIFTSNDISDLSSGTYAFTLNVAGASHALEVFIDKTVTDPDRNLDVLRKIQSAISGADANVEAEVSRFKRKSYDPFAGISYEQASYLTVSNKATGKDMEFALADSSGDIISALGLDKTRHTGGRNLYSVNGISGSAEANTISLDADRLTATLKGTTFDNGRVQIKVKDGIKTLALELNDIVGEYNDLLTWLDDNRRYVSHEVKAALFEDIGAESVRRNFLHADPTKAVFRINANSSIASRLSGIGLILNEDGSLVAGDGFGQALERDIKGVYDALAGDDGFFTKIGGAVDDILVHNVDRFVLERSTYLNYDATGADKQSITRQGVSSLLSLYV